MGTLLMGARGVQKQLQWALMHQAPAATSLASRGLAAAAAAATAAAAAPAAMARKPTAAKAAASTAAAAAATAAASASASAASAAARGATARTSVRAAAAATATAASPLLPPCSSPLPALFLRALAERQGQPLLLLLQQQQQPAASAAAAALVLRRAFASTTAPRWAQQQQAPQPSQQQQAAAAAAAKKAADAAAAEQDTSLELTEEKMRAITDKIPQRPVGIVEGTSYTLLIAGAFAVLAFFAYNFVTTFLLEPAATQCFNAAAQRLRADPRITVRLGADITAYGQESASRAARQAVPHVMYKDAQGVEHCRLQFHLRGAGGAVALVNADMYRGGGGGGGADGAWEYSYLIADVATPGGGPGGARPQQQRLVIVAPR